MHKPYLLLRNNKQQGPFSLEELLQQSLKPFDLVWVEGKSAGWKYPTEIDALKSHIEAVKQPLEVNQQVSVATSPAIETSTQEKKTASSRKKIYVSMPGGIPPSVTTIEEESFSKKLEKKAEELYRRAQAYAEKKNEATKPAVENSSNADNELQTNYARSLDDIKEEYSNWLYTQKTSKKVPKRKMSVTVMVTIAILLAGFTTAKFIFNKQQTSTAAENPEQSLASAEKATPKSSDAQNSNQNSKKTSLSAKRNTGISKKKNGTSKDKKSILPVNKNGDGRPKKPNTSTIYLGDLVNLTTEYVPNENGIPDFIITVHNNSDQTLSYVAVDLYYYPNDGSVGRKKTIYFNGLSPHQSLSQKTAANETLVLKMGLIRNEEGELFYAKL